MPSSLLLGWPQALLDSLGSLFAPIEDESCESATVTAWLLQSSANGSAWRWVDGFGIPGVAGDKNCQCATDKATLGAGSYSRTLSATSASL